MKSNTVPGWEHHLVRRAQEGETIAFELLADAHRGAMMHLALRMLRNSEDAADAVQEALLKALKAIAGFQAGRPVQPWLLRICANCCVDIVRHRKVNTDSLDLHEFALADPSKDVDEIAEAGMVRDRLRAAVNRLPATYKNIVVMRHFEQMDIAEIARALNKPEGTIKSWLFRARMMLRNDLMVVPS